MLFLFIIDDKSDNNDNDNGCDIGLAIFSDNSVNCDATENGSLIL
jgi:hypothetical protein